MLTPFVAMNAVGTVAFGVAGASKGVDRGLDYLGVTVLGVVTALGGGITRDLLVGRIPSALTSGTDVTFALGGVALAVALVQAERGRLADSALLTIPDAVGLAAFAATGAIVGVEAGLSAFGVVVCATLTGVGGGALRDVLAQEVPSILHEDFYATCAIAGGTVFWALWTLRVAPPIPTATCVVVALGLRLVAMRRGWSLPTVG